MEPEPIVQPPILIESPAIVDLPAQVAPSILSPPVIHDSYEPRSELKPSQAPFQLQDPLEVDLDKEDFSDLQGQHQNLKFDQHNPKAFQPPAKSPQMIKKQISSNSDSQDSMISDLNQNDFSL